MSIIKNNRILFLLLPILSILLVINSSWLVNIFIKLSSEESDLSANYIKYGKFISIGMISFSIIMLLFSSFILVLKK